MSSQPLRAGVIGLGWAGRQHADAYFELPGVELVALAAFEDDLRRQLGEHYAVAPARQFRDGQQLISAGDLDLVSIATPTSLHGPLARAAMAAGMHVLSEKPLAENAEVARAMVQAATQHDRVLEVSFNHRLRGDVRALKSVIDGGALGRIYYAKAGWLRREGIPGLDSWFTRTALSGGGPMMDIGVHMLDMALHLLGEPEVHSATAATYAEFGPRGRGAPPSNLSNKTPAGGGTFDVEDLATAFLRLGGGATLLLESSWASWIGRDSCYLTLLGTEGGASLEWGGSPSTEHDALTIWTEVDGIPAELQPVVGPSGGHRQCVVDFLDEVRSADYSRFRGQQALTRAEVVGACYTSARTGTEVRLSGATERGEPPTRN